VSQFNEPRPYAGRVGDAPVVNPFPIIFSAPSGGGKTTISKRLLGLRSDVGYSVSATTRLPRHDEVEGRDYHFLTYGEFEAKRKSGEFAESAEVHGKLYGTLRREVEKVLGSGRHVIMDIDVQGARQFKQAFPQSVLVFLLPPSADVLLARLQARRTEDPADLMVRLETAKRELTSMELYQYVVVNGDLDVAVREVSAIIDAEQMRRERAGETLAARVVELVQGLDRDIGRLRNQVDEPQRAG
jgi:guanylate kinase